MLANCLIATEAKRLLKKRIHTVSNLIDLIPFFFNLSNVGEIFWGSLESERTVFKLRKRKIKFLCCVHHSIKRVRKISTFHSVAVVQ